MRPQTSRTTGPLHFEDLEPHRFEDLIRQLAYDFREWSRIEAIGRTGADDGADSRAYEIIRMEQDGNDEEEDELRSESLSSERLWIIQCKRQASFTPQQAIKAVKDVQFEGPELPHGLILAAPANVSLATRRAFATEARTRGFKEFYLWGKGELEDQLYLAKNDHLLFSYFGFSLQIRRRSERTRQRSLLTLKKQLVKILGDMDSHGGPYVLIRTPDEEDYPFVQDRASFRADRKWWYYPFKQHWPPDKVHFEVGSFPAFINPDTGEWDAIFQFDFNEDGYPQVWGIEVDHGGPDWKKEWDERALNRERYLKFFEVLPAENKGRLSILGSIPYDRILVVDELGDGQNDGPHLVIQPNPDGSYFDETALVPHIDRMGSFYPKQFLAREDKKISHFPKKFPKLTRKQFDTIIETRRERASEELAKIEAEGDAIS